MASSTPGYWTLTATARPSRVMARWTWPIEADGDRHRVPLEEQPVGRRRPARARRPRRPARRPSAGRPAGAPARASRTCVGQARRRGSDAIWPSFIMAPFMLPEGVGHLLGGAQLELAGRARPGARRRRTSGGPGAAAKAAAGAARRRGPARPGARVRAPAAPAAVPAAGRGAGVPPAPGERRRRRPRPSGRRAGGHAARRPGAACRTPAASTGPADPDRRQPGPAAHQPR